MSVHICRTPMREASRESVGIRWCFVCRKRVEFFYVVSETVEPSYYEPSIGIECGRKHYDGDLFPGRFRDWYGEWDS